MTPDAFLADFGHFADAPNGVQKLRELILQLAVQGKLVPQDPTEGTASDALAEILEARERFVADASRVRSTAHTTAAAAAADVPFDKPDGWEWIRIGQAMHLVNGRAFKKSEWSAAGLPIIRIQNLNTPEAPFNYCETTVDERFHVYDDDFLISWSGTPGTSFGAFIWRRGHGLLNQHIFKAHIHGNGFDKVFLRLAVNGRLDEMISQAQGGVGIKHITKGKLEALFIPLPPLAEQKRIVAKVDQLMVLCDELEVRKQKRREARVRCNNAALDALLKATGPDYFAAHWQRLGNHFDLLYDHPETIAKLRAAILQLAVQGKLVPQNPGDEPANVLLAEIARERSRLISEGTLRKTKQLAAIPEEEKPHGIPDSWEWVRLGSVQKFVNGFAFKSQEYCADGIGIVRIGDIQNGSVIETNMKQVPIQNMRNLSADLQVSPGSMVIAMSGATTGKIGFNNTQNTFLLNQRVGKIVPIKVSREYLYRYLSTKIAENLKISAGSAIPNLSTEQINDIVLPLPPSAEQDRIVAKVDQLMALCDDLETKLTRAQEQSGKLMEATVRHFVGQAPKPSPSPAPAKPQPPKQQSLPIPEAAPPRNPRTAPNGSIPQAILDHMQPATAYSRADIVDALGISTGDWNCAIKQLKEAGQVEQTGQRRGARYQLTI